MSFIPLWIPITIAGATAQVFRNGAQASLTGRIGTLGATQVRFVFGLPFAALFLGAALLLTDSSLPAVGRVSLGWVALGAVCQIIATALMLMVMHQRAFGVAYAYIKTEPAIVALLGVVILGDRLAPLAWLAIAIVTVGVLLSSVKPSQFRVLFSEGPMIAAGVGAGALFGLSAISFRGAIGALEGTFFIRSLTMVVVSLAIQSALLGAWLAIKDRGVFIASLREWRHSIGAGLLGAISSACWFTAFSLTPAANVRTLGLVEMPLAAAISGRLSGKAMAWHELLGMVVVMGGVGLLLTSLAT